MIQNLQDTILKFYGVSKMSDHNTIGVIAPTVSRAGHVFLENLIQTLAETHKEVYLVTGSCVSIEGSNIQCFCLEHRGSRNITQIFNYGLLELKIARTMISLSKKTHTWVFFMGAECMLIPMLIARAFRMDTVICLAGSIEKLFSVERTLLYIPLILMKNLNLFLVSNIVIYSENLLYEWGLQKWEKKIFVAHRHFLDFDTFNVTTPLSDRLTLVGYIGRLSGEKGVQHFAQALPAILSDRQDLHVLIGGDGQLKETIEVSLQEQALTARVELPGWISHDDLPRYLNQLRLLVLPSYTEGLPNIMLEAMACGTPVLATPVGAIPDIIIDGKTGFIMENNSPECIAENVIRALNSPDLEEIAKAGRRFVEESFTFERVVENWRGILQNIE
jgi:glycosyltransferase involved in cell wall biosynthesis